MKNTNMIRLMSAALTFLVALTSQSCLKDQEDVFEDSASARMQKYLETVRATLVQPEHGWRMEYYAGNSKQDYGGYNFANKSYGVSGWGGDYFVDFGNVIAQYDEETGNLVFRTYNVGENLDLYKDGRSWVVGLYGDIDIDGANSPVNGNNLKLATGTLSADGSKATIEANEVQLTTGERYKYVHMWWYGFSNDGHYVIYNGKRPPFPCSLSKIRSLGASSLIKVESNVISNNYEKASVDFRNGVAFVHRL